MLHVGNLRTALLAWLFARSRGARFALRIEDLDPQRSRPEHERDQRADLAALGIDWDAELPRQSERGERYREAIDRLAAGGRVYECWCTRAEIRAATQAPHGEQPEGSYPGTCRDLSADERERRRRDVDRPPALRIDARAERLRFDDAIHGSVEHVVDDFVLWRGDGVASYNLAVAVDDCDQGIGEVVRGDDLLETTPRQLLLARLLGLRAPTYAHVPLVLSADGSRLAKRHGAMTLADRAAVGDDAAAVLDWIAASLGLAEPGERATTGELVNRFDPARIPRSATVFEE